VRDVFLFLARVAGFAARDGFRPAFERITQRNTVDRAFGQLSEIYYRLELKRGAIFALPREVVAADGEQKRLPRWPSELIDVAPGQRDPRTFHAISTKGANAMLAAYGAAKLGHHTLDMSRYTTISARVRYLADEAARWYQDARDDWLHYEGCSTPVVAAFLEAVRRLGEGARAYADALDADAGAHADLRSLPKLMSAASGAAHIAATLTVRDAAVVPAGVESKYERLQAALAARKPYDSLDRSLRTRPAP
jgi:hypothetical protein